MKKNLQLLIILLISFKLTGAQSADIYRQTALNFFNERLALHQHKGRSAAEIKNYIQVSPEGRTIAYAFNFSGGGFVLVSASENTFPVLGYSLEGTYTGTHLPDALQAWIRYYGRQTGAVADQPYMAEEVQLIRSRYTSSMAEMTGVSGRVVEPLLRTVWDQGNYYNGMCPPDPDGPGGRCYAGCVATAVGQLMFYHRWPEQGTGEYSYTHPDYGLQYANFGSTTYAWNGMETSLSGPNPHIALLLYHLGISFDMDYGPDGSGMWNHSAANSMRTYFKYGPQTQYIFRDTTTMNWDSILVANLDARKPLYYAGWEGVGSQNGHAFVCDGYAPDNFYHFNWGWSGSYDGYFLLSALTPGGSNFNFAQEVIKDIYPDTTQYIYPPFCAGADTLNYISGTFSDGSNMIAYPGGSACQWLIKPDEPDYDSISGIHLSFPGFELAQNDRLLIFSGNDTTTPPIAELTGDETPGTIEINASSATVVFDAPEGNAGGFLASYKSVLPVYCSGTTNFNQSSGMFDDGSGDKNYVNNSLCKWRIVPQNPVPLTLTFDAFDTEEGKDILKIYDLGNQSLIASLSGDTLPEPITLNSGKFYLVFNTDGSGTASGWTIRWNPEGSVGIFSETRKEFTIHPNPAGDYLILRGVEKPLKGPACVYNMEGRLLFERMLSPAGSGEIKMDISRLAPGFYLLKLETGEECLWQKFIKL
ncbi:C10 family peptidase [Lentimicrobium sp.]|uniref:C10 family peptidase n=1 Tax=Lentimicrobium sp. TaxID=2034841 RepID=UPI002D0D7538|nr:C10 family peptidase [Lentimicrobium sp.]HRW68905.1 C10 family peptidase [Lentimicrobium sp.]